MQVLLTAKLPSSLSCFSFGSTHVNSRIPSCIFSSKFHLSVFDATCRSQCNQNSISKNALPFYMSSPPSSPSKHTTNGTEASASAVAPVPAAAVAPQPTAAALNPATIVPQQPTAIPIDPASSKAVLNPAQIQRTKLQNIPAFLNKLYK